MLFLLPLIFAALPFVAPSDNAVMIELRTFRLEEVMAVREQLVIYEKSGRTDVWLKINSSGGSIENGLNLIQTIESLKSVKLTCVVDHKAYSFGFFLLQACPVRLMTTRSTLMAHEPIAEGLDGGNSTDLKNMAKVLDALGSGLAQIVIERMGLTREQYFGYVGEGKSWWLDFKEAENRNAVDGFSDPKLFPLVTSLADKIQVNHILLSQ